MKTFNLDVINYKNAANQLIEDLKEGEHPNLYVIKYNNLSSIRTYSDLTEAMKKNLRIYGVTYSKYLSNLHIKRTFVEVPIQDVLDSIGMVDFLDYAFFAVQGNLLVNVKDEEHFVQLFADDCAFYREV